jgi:hypothetical protein
MLFINYESIICINNNNNNVPSIFKDESTETCICLRSLMYMSHVNKVQPIRVKMICLYVHISECVQTVYELPLLPNNTASETFLYKSGEVRSVDWI